MSKKDIRVVISIDFGTTFSGFSYSHYEGSNNETIITNNSWPAGKLRESGLLKIPTILEYDKNLKLLNWGLGVGSSQGNKKAEKTEDQTWVIELFKLHLAESKSVPKSPLPHGLTFERAISDYLEQMAKEIRERLKITWNIALPSSDILLVVTIPVGWKPTAQRIMRECCLAARLIDHVDTPNLHFTTEPEAAAMHCRELFGSYDIKTDDIFMIVDCGGGTVDLTARKLLKDGSLSEKTEAGCGYCGGSYVDKAFIQFIARELGICDATLATIQEKHGNKIRRFIKSYFWPMKFAFCDEESFGDPDYQIDLELHCAFFMKYVSDEVRERLVADEWCIYLDFGAVKDMFEPSVSQILELIRQQLDQLNEPCAAMFLVGGFAESKYVQNRIRQVFEDRVVQIPVPIQPQIAILKGAAKYGLGIDPDTGYSKDIRDRVLKYTYGTDILSDWRIGDPPEKNKNGKVKRFSVLARRGQQFTQDQKYSEDYYPVFIGQKAMKLDIYYTDKDNAKYIDEVIKHQEWKLDLPPFDRGVDRSVTMSLMFGQLEIHASATSKHLDEPVNITCIKPE